MGTEVLNTITLTTIKPESKWAAMDFDDKIIAEGATPQEVIEKSDKITKDYFVTFIPEKGNTYIF